MCKRKRYSEAPKSHATTTLSNLITITVLCKSNSNVPNLYKPLTNVQGSVENHLARQELLHDIIFLTFFAHVDGLEVLDEDLPSFGIDNQPAVGVAMHNLDEPAAVVNVLHVLIVC